MSIQLNRITKKLRSVGAIREDQTPRAGIFASVQGSSKANFDAINGMQLVALIGLGSIGLVAWISHGPPSGIGRVLLTVLALASLVVIWLIVVRSRRRGREASTTRSSGWGLEPEAIRGFTLAIVEPDLIVLPLNLWSRPRAPAVAIPLASIQSVELGRSKTVLGFTAADTLTVRFNDGHPMLLVEHLQRRVLESFARQLGSSN